MDGVDRNVFYNIVACGLHEVLRDLYNGFNCWDVYKGYNKIILALVSKRYSMILYA